MYNIKLFVRFFEDDRCLYFLTWHLGGADEIPSLFFLKKNFFAFNSPPNWYRTFVEYVFLRPKITLIMNKDKGLIFYETSILHIHPKNSKWSQNLASGKRNATRDFKVRSSKQNTRKIWLDNSAKLCLPKQQQHFIAQWWGVDLGCVSLLTLPLTGYCK